jgi:dTMP kinase
MPMRGRFVTVEGVEGVGKSTNVTFVAATIEAAGHTVRVSREPGGTALAEAVRQLLLAPGSQIDPLAELLLVFAARADHLRQVIEPALAAGEWVVCDRFTDASYAYQGGGRGLPEATIAALESLVQGALRPDLTLLLDAPPAVTDERLRQRAPADRFELEAAAFFARVRAAYLDRARREPDRIRVIRTDRSLAEVQRELLAGLAPTLASAREMMGNPL